MTDDGRAVMRSNFARYDPDQAMQGVIRAFLGYLFLLLIVRIVGRRPGKQLTPFEFVLIFFIGGLALTGIVGDERSFTNATCQIITLALVHYAVSWGRSKSSRFARLIDGTPLTLLKEGRWQISTMKQMRIADDDVMFAARDRGIKTLQEIDSAVLERNGDISVQQKATPDE
jgi:uncharacterized membrane protein YcaP (DUF421 family)